MIARTILERYAQIEAVNVTVRKPSAPIPATLGFVAVEVTRDRERSFPRLEADVDVDADVEALFERVALGFGEPFADSSALPTVLVSALARAAMKHMTAQKM